MDKVESFELDHRKVVAPYVRKCCTLKGEKGDIITKFDLRFMQPNKEEMDIKAIHTLEHFLATFLRENLNGVIDLSPMGCRTGFYMIIWGEVEPEKVKIAIENSLKKVLEQVEIPAANEIQCGNYKEHSLEKAKEYANQVLKKGFSTKIYGE